MATTKRPESFETSQVLLEGAWFFQTPSTVGDEVDVGRAAHSAEKLFWCHLPQNPSIFFYFIHRKFQPVLEEMFRFISNSAVRNKSLQAACAGAFFTRWLSHGRVLTNMHKGLAGMLTGLKDIANNKNIDYAKASGLRYQVQWLFRIHRDS